MTSSYDVVVVGAGIQGVGVAQAAAASGYSVLVLEKRAVAWATSSRSSKLIHGGLRYLESAQFRLVRESLRERALLLRNAPDLVRLVPFHIPVYRHTKRRPWQLRVGLSLYALLGGLDASARFRMLPRSQWRELDGLDTNGLQAVFRYYDAQTDDARLTAAVLRSAQNLGAQLACPAEFRAALWERDAWTIRYHHAERDHECRGRALVNAAGPWVNDVLEHVVPVQPPLAVDLIQGAHVVLPGKLERGIYYVEAPQDRRAVFLMPWPEGVLVGTTESPFHGDPSKVEPLPSEIAYLAETAQRYFPAIATQPTSAFAGLRVLPQHAAGVFHRPRDTHIAGSERTAPGLLTVCGGKLTGYRATADKVMARLAARLPAHTPRAQTEHLKLSAPN